MTGDWEKDPRHLLRLADERCGDVLSDDSWDETDKWLEPWLAFLCGQLGHNVIADQCGKPEHDYCTWCMQLFPGQAK